MAYCIKDQKTMKIISKILRLFEKRNFPRPNIKDIIYEALKRYEISINGVPPLEGFDREG